MTNCYLSYIDKNDCDAVAVTRESHAHGFEVVEAALDRILLGLSDYGFRKQKPDSRQEGASLFLAARSFNSIRTALPVLERGYYQQAMALVRMAMEDQLVAHDIWIHPPTLDALLEGNGTLGKGKLTFGNMAIRVSAKAKEAWDDDYGSLSQYAAHPRIGSMRGLVDVDSDGQIVLRAGGRYDEIWVNTVLYHLLRQLVLIFEIIAKVTASAGIDWVTGAVPILDEIMALWGRVDEWASQQLEEIDGCSEQAENSVDC